MWWYGVPPSMSTLLPFMNEARKHSKLHIILWRIYYGVCIRLIFSENILISFKLFKSRVCGGKMGIGISEVLASLEPCFYVRSVVRMAPRRLTEKAFL